VLTLTEICDKSLQYLHFSDRIRWLKLPILPKLITSIAHYAILFNVNKLTFRRFVFLVSLAVKFNHKVHKGYKDTR